MYKSLKSWLKVPIQIKPFVKRDGTGTASYADTIETYGYIEGGVKLISDSKGAEVISTSQIFLEGSTRLSELDLIIIDGVEHSIKTISTFYDRGKPDIKVVYL